MQEAYLLITCDLDKKNNVLKNLNNITELSKIEQIYGPYDIIVKISSDTLQIVKEIVNQKIKTIDDIQHTLLLPIKISD